MDLRRKSADPFTLANPQGKHTCHFLAFSENIWSLMTIDYDGRTVDCKEIRHTEKNLTLTDGVPFTTLLMLFKN